MIDNGQLFDLPFTDVIVAGRQLAYEVKKRRPAVKALHTSGYTDNATVHQGRLDPGALLLTKLFRKFQLANMIRRTAGGGNKAQAPALAPSFSIPT
jgi:hypothetical protein